MALPAVPALSASREADPGGAWTQVTRPRPAVPGLLRWTGWTEDGGAWRQRREAGAPSVLLMLQVGAPLVVAGRQVRSFVAPASDTWTDTGAVGVGVGVHLDLHPLLARRLLDRPLGELGGHLQDAGELDQPWLDELTARLADTADWSVRLDLVEAALRHRLRRNGSGPDTAPIAEAHRLLHGGATVTEAGAAIGWGRRRLHRRLTAEIGLTPSQVRRLGRFARTRRLLEGTDLPVADVAARTGWTDQSHLHREVRAIAGRTPTQLRLAAGTVAGTRDVPRAQDVPSVQDGGAVQAPSSGA